MKHWSTVFVHSLLWGAVFGSSDLATDCISTHLLPVITTSVSVPGHLPTDLMPEATGAIPAPGSNQSSGSGSPGSNASQGDAAKPNTASMDAGIHSNGGTGQGSGYDNPTGAATTPLSSANPQLVSGAFDLRRSNLAKTAFVAGSVVLIVQMASLV
ncbi:hypothetical protein FCOIX_12302 [Fusarium coicis]|nr:hypothetical protein FCOIX_12302 [Fusarium coicis]